MRKRYELGEGKRWNEEPMIWDIEHLFCGLVYLFLCSQIHFMSLFFPHVLMSEQDGDWTAVLFFYYYYFLSFSPKDWVEFLDTYLEQ